MNLQEFNAAIDAHLVGWNPTLIIRDNEPAPTSGVLEFIRLTVLHGVGFVDEVAGIYSVNGSTTIEPFILDFGVFTEINTGTERSSELCQMILDHWQVRNLGSKDLHLIAGSPQTIGEEPPRYHVAVQISGTREDRLINRE